MILKLRLNSMYMVSMVSYFYISVGIFLKKNIYILIFFFIKYWDMVFYGWKGEIFMSIVNIRKWSRYFDFYFFLWFSFY